MKICKQCNKQFKIDERARNFYQKFEVQEADYCSHCREIQIMAWRNERTFYSSVCANCNQKMVSSFSADSPFKIFCKQCWWADNFDPLKYGRDFDFNKPFFEQFWDLMQNVPMANLFIASSENSDYSSYAVSNRNCYMVTGSDENEDCFYLDNSNHNRDACDSSFSHNSELICECVDVVGCYRCVKSENLRNCSECYFCADMIGCSDCIACTGQRNAKYMILNQQYSKEEYEKQKLKMKLSSFADFENLERIFINFKKANLRASDKNIGSENCSGSYLVHCKDCWNCVDMLNCENCLYSHFGYKTKDAMDIYGAPNSELVYMSCAVVKSYNVQFSTLVWPSSSNVYYSFLNRAAKNVFGCISLLKNENCILNQQYSKEEYEKLFARIKEHMKETGEWGQYFPLKYAPWAYNETIANDFYPENPETAVAMGVRWQAKLPGVTGQASLKNLPDDIENVKQELCDEILKCECQKNYKIGRAELQFYQKMKFALPRKCPSCRFKLRFGLHQC